MKSISKILTCLALTGGIGVQAQTFTNYTTNEGLLNNSVNDVHAGVNNTVWFGTQDGVSSFDGSTWNSYTTTSHQGLVHNTIQAIYEDAQGDVWVGTDFGISVFDGSSFTSYTTIDGLGNNQIKCITEDNGTMLFGTSDGFSMFDGTNWTNFDMSNGLPFGGVNSITVHSGGDYYLGSGLGGVIIYDGSGFTEVTENEGILNNRIRAIAFDDQDQRWVGTSDGITVLDDQDQFSTNHTTMFTLPAPDTLNPIEDVKVDGYGNVWVGVYVDYLVTEGGICAYDGSGWVDYDVSDGLVGPVVRALAIDDNNNVWVATSTGVSKISNAPIGVEEIEKENQFVVYPNPAEHFVNVKFNHPTEDKQIEIYNTGMQLMDVVWSGADSTLTIDLDEFPSGVYFIRSGKEVVKFAVK